MPNPTTNLPKIEIQCDGAMTTLTIDGREIPGAIACTFHCEGGSLPYLMLKVFGDIHLSGYMMTPLPEPWRSWIKSPSPADAVFDKTPEERLAVAEAIHAEELRRIYEYFKWEVTSHSSGGS